MQPVREYITDKNRSGVKLKTKNMVEALNHCKYTHKFIWKKINK